MAPRGVSVRGGERGRERLQVKKTHLVPFRIFKGSSHLTLFGKLVKAIVFLIFVIFFLTFDCSEFVPEGFMT